MMQSMYLQPQSQIDRLSYMKVGEASPNTPKTPQHGSTLLHLSQIPTPMNTTVNLLTIIHFNLH